MLGTQIAGDKLVSIFIPSPLPFFFPFFSSFLLPSIMHSYISTTSGCFQDSGL